jgi:hypothetical protein
MNKENLFSLSLALDGFLILFSSLVIFCFSASMGWEIFPFNFIKYFLIVGSGLFWTFLLGEIISRVAR